MKREAYPAARTVSPKVQAYFARQAAVADHRTQGRATVPDAESIESVIDAAFWASLRREEGYPPRISLAFLSPSETPHPLMFERPLQLHPAMLTRVAPAVERAGIHLGVWRGQDELSVWGTTRAIPSLCFVLEVAAPGLLVIKHHTGDESRKFVNVAVLEGDQIKWVDEYAADTPDRPVLMTSLLGFDSPASWVRSVNVLVQLAVSMRAHNRGGSLLVVPTATESWRESIARGMPYAVSPPFAQLSHLSREVADGGNSHAQQEALDRTIDAIAGLTAVDGAVVMTNQYQLLGFGAKITRRKGCGRVERIRVTEPIEGGVAMLAQPEELGGTRHQSAAQFVQDQRNAVALVASQDGRFTIFEWSPAEEMVHAHRIEALLL
jgi:hypothetical protein